MTEIREFINNDFKALRSNQSVSAAQDFFIEYDFSHFPVTENGVYMGSLSSEDADTFEVDKTIADYRYTLEPFFVRDTTSWLDVLEVFANNHTNVVPVLNAENRYVGYYEFEDIIKFFHDTPFLKEQGGIIVVEKPVLDYSMSQVAQIVESNNGRILGLFISDATVDTVQITVKISLGAMNDIIQTFRRYNYEIVSEHNEDNYINNLRERSDYLDKYLNI
ncbi:CBS domain-containing protein [Flavobacterium sp. CYK-55]|uniref:CBS domain-containing protein n=1 Tax=Flavobacterium sp. CYK-55 TaxID=2835529 RepID=UPI001BCE6B81|nr:CBS domain-containing protein [Flavobacterium sp. CYK-55]MBS7787379.1 CBS domain-containing protein [Flavobacterium sp. CYK-55]